MRRRAAVLFSAAVALRLTAYAFIPGGCRRASLYLGRLGSRRYALSFWIITMVLPFMPLRRYYAPCTY